MNERDYLVAIIRGVHEALRRDYQNSGGDAKTVWTNHLYDVEKRKRYSQAMFQLATTAWLEKNTRITWCHQICIEYFYRGKLEKLFNRVLYNLDRVNIDYISYMKDRNKIIIPPFQNKIRLLDVGSCYNPFSVYSEYHCLALDLTPAVKGVHQCDFLRLQINPIDSEEATISPDSENILALTACTFDAVVFSLVLEYLPSPKQRWIFCCKAWELLKYNGLLLIATPDSKKQHCNAPMMRQWKLSLKNIGFQRIAYEKQMHIHCMAFQKVFKQVSRFPTNENIQLLYIPQDFHKYVKNSSSIEQKDRTEEENQYIQFCFTELPEFI